MSRRRSSVLVLALLAGCARELSLPTAPSGAPAEIDDLRATHVGDEVTLLFTAPAAGGLAATDYDLRVGAREEMTAGLAAEGTALATPGPSAPGTPERLVFARPLPEAPALCFVLRARLGAVDGPFSAPACVDFAPPGAPTLSAAAAPGGRAILLTFAPPADDDVTTLLLVRAPEAPPVVTLAPGPTPEPGAAAGGGIVVAKLPATAGEHRDAGLLDGARWGYALLAIDEGGNASPAATAVAVAADLSAPPEAPSFTAAGLGEARVRLDWTLPQDPTEQAPLAVTLVRRFDAPVEEGPEDGRAYVAGDALGEGELLYDGPALSFTDAGLPAGAALHYALYVRDAAHNYAPPVRADAISVQGPTISDLTIDPEVVRAGRVVEISFALAGTPTVDPEVTVGSLYALLAERPATPAGRWRFTYRAFGGEPEGLGVPVEVRAIDATGTAARRTPISFDFTPPSLVSGAVEPSALRRGVEGALTFLADEPLAAGTTATLDGLALACAPPAIDETQRCTVPAPTAADPDGPVSVELRLVDRAGNEAEAQATFTRDSRAIVDVALIAREERFDGRRVVFEPGALEPFAAARVSSDEAGASLLGAVLSDAQGGAPALDLASDPAELYLHERDRAGNESGPVRVTRLDRRSSLDDPAAALRATGSGSLLPRADELGGALAVDAASRAAQAATATEAPVGAARFSRLLRAPPEVTSVAMSRSDGTGPNDPERLFFFGGTRPDGSESDELWSWDGAAFVLHAPAGARPGARSRASLAQDSLAHVLLLFGGEQAGQLLGDLWSYDPAADRWTELTPRPPLPSPRRSAGLWFDPLREGGRALLYGGVGAGGVERADFWAWVPAARAWREEPIVEMSGWPPPAGATGVGALRVDPYETVAVLAPDSSAPTCPSYEHYWSPGLGVLGWSGNEYASRPASCGAGMAIAAGDRTDPAPFLVSGGTGRETLFNCYTGIAWFGEQAGLPPRRFHALGYHRGTARHLSLGGQDASGVAGRAFRFDGATSCGLLQPIPASAIEWLFPLPGAGLQLASETGGELVVAGPFVPGTPPELFGRSGGALRPRTTNAAPSPGLFAPHPTSGLLFVQPGASPARTLRSAALGPFFALATTREPTAGRDYRVVGLDGVGTLLSDGAVSFRFRNGDWSELLPGHPLDAQRRPRGLARDLSDGQLLLAGDDGGTFRWTGVDFEPVDAWPAAPPEALPAGDAGRVYAFAPAPTGLTVVEWAGGGWVGRAAPSAPRLTAPTVASLTEGGLALAGDPATPDLHHFTAAPARLPHVLATLPLVPGPTPTRLRVTARVGGTGIGPDGQLCHGALLAVVDPGGGRALRLATTDAPADAPAELSALVPATALAAFANAAAVELVVSPRCAADVAEASVTLEAAFVQLSSER